MSDCTASWITVLLIKPERQKSTFQLAHSSEGLEDALRYSDLELCLLRATEV